MAATTLNPGEEAQLQQTIEMFEVIVTSQPSDTQSLEILKEAYTKLGREQEVVNTSKRIAQAYLQQGQLSSAILEYETVLQRRPDDADVRAALKQIEDKASNAAVQSSGDGSAGANGHDTSLQRRKLNGVSPDSVEDGRKMLYRIFVDAKLISAGDFDLCWRAVDLVQPPTAVVEPFIHILNDKAIHPIEKSLRVLSEKSRVPYLPLERYDVDMDFARGFPSDLCRRWCVLPFDRMSKAVLVATANPFNQQAAKDLAGATTHRLIWYLASPAEIMSNLRKAFR